MSYIQSFFLRNFNQLSNNNMSVHIKVIQQLAVWDQKTKKNQKKNFKTQKHKNNSRNFLTTFWTSSSIFTHFLMYKLLNCIFLLFVRNLLLLFNILTIICKYIISMLQKTKLISKVSKFGPMLRINPTFLVRMLRV
jgi:hypothetical protein